MAKTSSNQKARLERSPIDRRRSKRFDNSPPMPLLLQNILREELARLVSCKQGGFETKLPAQELLVRNLGARAMNGDLALFELVLRYLPTDSDEVRAMDEQKRKSELLGKALANGDQIPVEQALNKGRLP